MTTTCKHWGEQKWLPCLATREGHRFSWEWVGVNDGNTLGRDICESIKKKVKSWRSAEHLGKDNEFQIVEMEHIKECNEDKDNTKSSVLVCLMS